MSQTRREFLVTTGVGMCAIAFPEWSAGFSRHAPAEAGAPLIEGDPYTAHVHDEGLGGRSFDAMQEHALRFRSTPEDRDRYLLGLEV